MIGAATVGRAQVFVMEHENNLREEKGDEEVLGWPVNPQNDISSATDSFAPLGGGILLLATFGGAYLADKRKKNGKNYSK